MSREFERRSIRVATHHDNTEENSAVHKQVWHQARHRQVHLAVLGDLKRLPGKTLDKKGSVVNEANPWPKQWAENIEILLKVQDDPQVTEQYTTEGKVSFYKLLRGGVLFCELDERVPRPD